MSDPLLRRLVAWAERHPPVRALVLVGSRAASDPRIDALSDHDLVLFLRDSAPYEERDDWLEEFGSVLVSLDESYEILGRTVPTRLVQFEDGLRIDFSLCDLDLLERLLSADRLPSMLDAGYRVLVDKDERLVGLPPPTGSAYVPGRPTESEFRDVVDEFWWETTCVARHLARGDTLPARYGMERILRFECLVPMLAWYVQLDGDWSEPLGPLGRGLTRLLAEDDRRRLERTFAGGDPTGMWEALDAMTELFQATAGRMADALGFDRPEALARRVGGYLERIRKSAEARGEKAR